MFAMPLYIKWGEGFLAHIHLRNARMGPNCIMALSDFLFRISQKLVRVYKFLNIYEPLTLLRSFSKRINTSKTRTERDYYGQRKFYKKIFFTNFCPYPALLLLLLNIVQNMHMCTVRTCVYTFIPRNTNWIQSIFQDGKRHPIIYNIYCTMENLENLFIWRVQSTEIWNHKFSERKPRIFEVILYLSQNFSRFQFS